MKHTFEGEIIDKEVIRIYGMRYNRSILENFVGKELTITIDEKKKPRSVAQNAWYWGVAIPTIIAAIQDYEGIRYTKEEIHQFIKQCLLVEGSKKASILGIDIQLKKEFKSTSQMSTVRFNEFKEELQHFFAKRSINIPDPKEI